MRVVFCFLVHGSRERQGKVGEKREERAYLMQRQWLLRFALAVKASVDGGVLPDLVQASGVLVTHADDVLQDQESSTSLIKPKESASEWQKREGRGNRIINLHA